MIMNWYRSHALVDNSSPTRGSNQCCIRSESSKSTDFTVRCAKQSCQYTEYVSLLATQACILNANGNKDAEMYPAVKHPKHLAPVVAIPQLLMQNKFSLIHTYSHVQLARDLETLLPRAVVVHHE